MEDFPYLDKAKLASYGKNGTFINFELNFNRNFSIVEIIIPLVAIFYLLGAIFILANPLEKRDSNLLAIRLSITLSVFAFLFTFTPIADQTKPLSVRFPTIADILITITIIATIAFSISSVIGNSSFMTGSYPKLGTWTDRFAFLLVSSVVVILFCDTSDSTIWFVPAVVLTGLGYGLLLKIVPIKRAKNKTIAK